ncbi:MAG: hypothetical protein RLY58_1790 [Pseudomonadota bacterium]|jgi:uncharacterized membrane protein YqiK
MQSILSILILAGIVLAVLVVIGIIFARLYRRATKETAYVRTGLRGQKVIMDGGAIVLPIFHGTIPVNMNTLKLEVERRQRESLITHDRMRVDVMAAFFVRVKQTEESVSTAAQTLGQRTMDPNALKALVEDKFVDALRSTAATMTMHELQDKRREFVQAVQNAVAEDLEKNGLELEAVSLTRLDQTDKQFFNPDNAFDAEGLTRLTEETQARRKQRNDIEQDTEVQVRAKNLEAERQRLDIEKQQEFATLSQQREIASTRAEQAALTATQEAQRHLESEGSRIEADRQVGQRRIEADRAIREAEIAKNLTLQTTQIEADRKTKVQQAMQHKEIEIANQDAKIAIATKSREQSEADAAANQALSEAVKAEELVKTAREVAVAERDKQIQLIDAAKGAEQQALTIRVAAQADRDAAIDRAEATKLTADADKAAALARAEGERALNEALNMLSAAQIDLKVRLQLLEQLPKILAEAVKPMEKIESIRMFQVNGLSNLGGQGQVTDGTAHPVQGGSLPDQVMNSALNYQIAKPLIDAIMQDAGLGNGSLTGIAQQLAAMNRPADHS